MPFEEEGLSLSEVEQSRVQHGRNILPQNPPPSGVFIFLSQLKNPLVYILLIAAVITLVFRHFTDTVVILLAVLINSVLGFIQEKRAGNALFALKKLLQPQARVLRSGQQETVSVEDIVVGDVVILSQGDKIPADGEILHANRLFISEAVITGESTSVAKHKNELAYMGTIVVSGRGFLRIKDIGANTQIGKIAQSIQEPVQSTPLKRQMEVLGRQLAVVVLILTAVVFVFGILKGLDPVEIFTISVALAVSAIPEGLLVSLTVVLALGMQQIAKRKGLVRNLVSAETLGGVTTICVDKTGTLTQGKMQVVEAIGDKKLLIRQSILANDLDDPIVIAAWEWSGGKNGHPLLLKHKRLDSIPFSSKTRYFASLNQNGKDNILFVNGAPEFLLEWSKMSVGDKKSIHQQILKASSQGMRLVAFAYKSVSKNVTHISPDMATFSLTWVGFLVLSDPLRPLVTKNLQTAQNAGIKVVVITGDYAPTAQALLGQAGITANQNTTITGEQLHKLNAEDLSEMLRSNKINLFARTSPDQKSKIVEALKQNGEVVAMMGDGVNDAPALKQADIGIVVAEATDVAKESADLVLLDSNFSTITAAVEEGRAIFENIRKITLYLLSNAFGEIVTVVGSLILGMPLAIGASQILWINLATDSFPALALTAEKKRKHILQDPPRSPQEPFITGNMKILIAATSLLTGCMALGLFILAQNFYGDTEISRSVSFLTLGLNSLILVLCARTFPYPAWHKNVSFNKWLFLALVGGFAVQVMPFLVPSLGAFLEVKTIPNQFWLYIVILTGVNFALIEIVKLVMHKKK